MMPPSSDGQLPAEIRRQNSLRLSRLLEGNMVPIVLVTVAVVAVAVQNAQAAQVSYFDVPRGAHPHDVAPAPDGTVWYTAKNQGAIGILDPKTGKVTQVPLGSGAAPHGVIVGPDR